MEKAKRVEELRQIITDPRLGNFLKMLLLHILEMNHVLLVFQVQ